MKPESDNLSVIIGASPRVEDLRRRLVRGGLCDLGVATSLPGLRRELHTSGRRLVVSCLLIDEHTIDRDSESLRCLLADAPMFAANFRCVGLVPNAGLIYEAARIGCHLYVRRPDEVLGALRALAGGVGMSGPPWRANRFARRIPAGSADRDSMALRRRLMDDTHTDRFDSWS